METIEKKVLTEEEKKRIAEADEQHKKLWSYFFIVVFSILLIINFFFGFSRVSVLVTLVIFAIVTIATMLKAVTQVPQKHQLIIEIFGKYIGRPLGPGLYYLFPWYFLKMKSLVPMNERMIALNLSDKVKLERGGGDIEFRDCSSSISAFFYFKVVDPELVTYMPEDVISFLTEKVEGALRSFLAVYKIDDAITLKSKFTLEAILSGINFSAEDFKERDFDSDKFNTNNSEFHRDLKRWGLKPTILTISDIDLPESVKQQRERDLVAEKDLQVAEIKLKQAEIDKKIVEVQAEARKIVRTKQGEGEGIFNTKLGEGQARRIKSLIDQGASHNEAVDIVISGLKWTAVQESKNNDKTLIIDGGPSTKQASSGAQFGAGFSTAKKNLTKEERSE